MPQPRKPTNILHLSGAFRKNPKRLAARMNEPNLPRGIGDAPKWLDRVGREEWARIVPDLESAGITSRVEATVLGCYCQAVSHLRCAEAMIRKDGITTMTDSGLKKHPAVNIAKEATAIIRAFASDFGMTPASRSKVSAKPADGAQSQNEFASA